jgi:hypothetical protein
MNGLLERLKRERRLAAVIFLGALGVIGAIRFAFAPDVPPASPSPSAVEVAP